MIGEFKSIDFLSSKPTVSREKGKLEDVSVTLPSGVPVPGIHNLGQVSLGRLHGLPDLLALGVHLIQPAIKSQPLLDNPDCRARSKKFKFTSIIMFTI